MGSLFEAKKPKVNTVKKTPTGAYKSAKNAFSNVNTNVNYTPINTGNVPSLVGSSTYDYIRGIDPTGLNAGGINASYSNGAINLNTSPFRNQMVGGVQDAYRDFGADLDQQRGTVAPGMSDFRTSALQRLEDARMGALSNLKDNMARRGILGSSFGEDAINRQNLEYEREAERINTEAYLKEIELTNQLSQQQAEAAVNVFQTGLNELNFQGELAAKLSSDANQFLSQSNAILSDLAKTDALIQSDFAKADATNRLNAQIAEIEAQLARASGQAKVDLTRARDQLMRQQGNQQANNQANQMQYEQSANNAAGFGNLVGGITGTLLSPGGIFNPF